MEDESARWINAIYDYSYFFIFFLSILALISNSGIVFRQKSLLAKLDDEASFLNS